MYHFTQTITNRSGDALSGYFVRLIDPDTLAVVTLAADNSGTPIITVSGVADMALTDDDGIASLYVEAGDYHLDIYAQNATTFIKRISDVPMRAGETGAQGIQGIPGTATAASTLIATRAALVSGNGSQTIFESQAPTGQTSSGSGGSGEDAVKFAVVTGTGKVNDGGIYYDNGLGIGWNISTAYTPINALLPSMSLRIESKFRQNSSGILGSEYHLPAHYPVGGGGVEWRNTYFMPHYYADRDSAEFAHSDIANTYTFSDGRQRLRKQIAYLSGGGASEVFSPTSGQPYTLNFELNGAAFLYQRNAAGDADLPHCYFDSRDIRRQSSGSYTSGASPATGVNANGFFDETLDSAPKAGGGARYYLPNAAVTGDWDGDKIEAFSVSGTYVTSFRRNTHASGKTIRWQEGNGDNGTALVNQFIAAGNFTYGTRASDGAFVVSNPGSGPGGFDRPVLIIYPSVSGNPNVIAMPMLQSFADDAAAATGGIPVGGIYRTSGALKVRLT